MSTSRSAAEMHTSSSFDIIFGLTRLRHLNHVADRILGYLDYVDLKNAELSSPVWREAIANGNLWKHVLCEKLGTSSSWEKMYNILWQKSFDGMSQCNQELGTPAFYRVVCHCIADSIKRVEGNWASGTASLENFEKYQEFRSCHDPDRSLKMNKNWIVRSISDGSFKIYNRWTCILEKKLIPKSSLGSLCFDFDDDYLVAGYPNPFNIHIWSISTGELIHDIRADEDLQLCQGFLGVISVHAYKSRRVLALKTFRRSAADEVVIRKMPGAGVIRLLTCMSSGVKIRDAKLDEDHLILLTTPKDFTEPSKIEIRSLDSHFEILRTIELPNRYVTSFSFSNGLALVDLDDFAGVWNVQTGQCVWTRPENDDIDAFYPKLVNGKYVVTVHLSDGQVTVFNLAGGAPMKLKSGTNGLPVRLEEVAGLLADDYQIFAFGRTVRDNEDTDNGVDGLNVFNFLNSDP